MTTLYDLFRTTWPGTVPAEQPDGLMLAKRIVKRLTPYRPTAGGLFVVLTGELRETVRSVGGRDAVIAHWGARRMSRWWPARCTPRWSPTCWRWQPDGSSACPA